MENIICLIIWAVIFVVSLIVELCTEQLVSVWFCVGSVVAIILAAIPPIPYFVSIIAFFAVSLLTLWVFLTFFKKKLFWRDNFKTNTEALIGTDHTLRTPISPGMPGEVNINGVIWRCQAATKLEKGTKIQVVEVVGNRLIVKPSEDKKGEE